MQKWKRTSYLYYEIQSDKTVYEKCPIKNIQQDLLSTKDFMLRNTDIFSIVYLKDLPSLFSKKLCNLKLYMILYIRLSKNKMRPPSTFIFK